MLHVHILFVTPLGSSHMAQSGANQYERRIASWKTAHHAGAPARQGRISCSICIAFDRLNRVWDTPFGFQINT